MSGDALRLMLREHATLSERTRYLVDLSRIAPSLGLRRKTHVYGLRFVGAERLMEMGGLGTRWQN